jgi:ABC-type transport system involved in cytochrome bd biosynthesis fused ATPase/permease subunit
MQVHGAADEVVMYGGKNGHYLSAAETQGFWVARLELAGAPSVTLDEDVDSTDATSMTMLTTRATLP